MNNKFRKNLNNQKLGQAKKEHGIWDRLKVGQERSLHLPLVQKFEKAIKAHIVAWYNKNKRTTI